MANLLGESDRKEKEGRVGEGSGKDLSASESPLLNNPLLPRIKLPREQSSRSEAKGGGGEITIHMDCYMLNWHLRARSSTTPLMTPS